MNSMHLSDLVDTHADLCFCFPHRHETGFHVFCLFMSPPEGLGDILFFPGRLSVRLSVTSRVRSVT